MSVSSLAGQPSNKYVNMPEVFETQKCCLVLTVQRNRNE